MPGELLWLVYAPVGAKGHDDGDDYETQVASQTSYLTQSQDTDTGSASPDPVTPTTLLGKPLKSGMGIKDGKVSGKVGAWGPQKAPSGGPGGNAPGGGQWAKPPEAF